MPPDMISAELSAESLVELLSDPHRSFRAYQRLIQLGPAATAQARMGLRHSSARVREYCCKVLDHTMDSDAMPALIGALSDPAERVRIAAAHALACDRCKQESCRPAAEDVLPPAISLLADDPDAHVRAMAVELVGRWVHSHPAAAGAIEQAAVRDPSPAVRKKASWYGRGGTIYRRTAPRY